MGRDIIDIRSLNLNYNIYKVIVKHLNRNLTSPALLEEHIRLRAAQTYKKIDGSLGNIWSSMQMVGPYTELLI